MRLSSLDATQLSLDWGDVSIDDSTSQPDTQPVGEASAQAAQQVLLVHPQANKDIDLLGVRVSYFFIRAKRKSIAMRVCEAGLEVRAPRFCLIGEVQSALHARAEWILNQLKATHQRMLQQQQQAIVWSSGGRVPFLGSMLTLRLLPEHDHAGPEARCTTPWHALDEGQTPDLLVPLPAKATPDQVRDSVQAWLMGQARSVFAQRLDYFAPQLNVQWHELKLSSAKSRWGSASRDGRIRLNWRLIHGPLAFTDYVVVHELSHLREMNHSPRFWQTVASVLPDYVEPHRALQSWNMPLF